ncbi:MAG: hypothetical protein ACC628_27225, partial [Pirellulaceae bacterium]
GPIILQQGDNILFLASSAASYVTGTVLGIDGGITGWPADFCRCLRAVPPFSTGSQNRRKPLWGRELS